MTTQSIPEQGAGVGRSLIAMPSGMGHHLAAAVNGANGSAGLNKSDVSPE